MQGVVVVSRKMKQKFNKIDRTSNHIPVAILFSCRVSNRHVIGIYLNIVTSICRPESRFHRYILIPGTIFFSDSRMCVADTS